MVDPDFPSPRPAGGPFTLTGIVAIGSLLLNLLLGGWLWQNQSAQAQRLARLEALSGNNIHPPADGSSEAAPGQTTRGQASRQERTAFLLASAGNADESKRILEVISVPDCAEIARTLIARPAAGDRNAALGAVFSRLADGDPAQAVALLDGVQEPMLRNALAVRVTSRWIDQSPDAAARWLAAQGKLLLAPEALDGQLARATVRWAAYDPEAATRLLAAQNPLGNRLLEALTVASLEWGRKDPQAALQWAQTLPAADPRRVGIVQGALGGWAERDPARAAVYLQGQFYDGGNGGELYVSLAGDLADRWAKTDLNAAAQWAATLPGYRARREALRRVATVWAAGDLPAAARWAGTLTGNGMRSDAWQAIVVAWPGDDLEGEGTWVGNLPAGPDRDEPVALHAGKVAMSDPEKALPWAQTIGERQFRAQSVQEILAIWQRKDQAAARNWAVANGTALPPPGRVAAPR